MDQARDAKTMKLSSHEWEDTIQHLAGAFNEADVREPEGLSQRHVTALQRAEITADPKNIRCYNRLPVGKPSPLQESETCYYATKVLTKGSDHLRLATVAWQKEPLESWLARAENQVATPISAPATGYTLPAVATGCTENTWTPTSGPPDGRVGHTAVWTGSEMIIWGGFSYLFPYTHFNTGGRYNPSTDNWTITNTANAPAGREGHTAVWTGSEMIVWGGSNGFSSLRTGGRYNPGADSWMPTSTTNAPGVRMGHTAVWTGVQMIVWGGSNNSSYLDTGGQYNPNTNSWTTTSTANAPAARYGHTAVWTGNRMIVWGGIDEVSNYSNTGSVYNPTGNNWTAITTTNAPIGRIHHTAVWTGTAMIIWGGDSGGTSFRTGGKYFPSTNTWAATTTINAPQARSNHTAIWTGHEMILWGGSGGGSDLNTGGSYNPGANSWTTTSTTNAPISRTGHTAVWSGSEIIIWGGQHGSYLNTGGRYNPMNDTWTPTAETPTPRRSDVAVWTGSEMIIWGGTVPFYIDPVRYSNTGGKYRPSTDSWTATTTVHAPAAREGPTAVWTGFEMIVWGGYFYDTSDHYWNTGGRYNPDTDHWLPTSTTDAPIGRASQTAVWTGVEMVVWGGYFYDGNDHYLNTGGKYNPETNRWTAIGITNAPVARASHGAVWTGREMIVWGGSAAGGYLNTGGRYNPTTDIWAATSTANAPSSRTVNGPVWTGSEMIIWGGYFFDGSDHYLNTGGRYNPDTNTWTATSTVNAPSARSIHTAVWTGSEMIVWGGEAGLDLGYYFATGGHYTPHTDTWTATSIAKAPEGRYAHKAVWTGNEMIVWGGVTLSPYFY